MPTINGTSRSDDLRGDEDFAFIGGAAFGGVAGQLRAFVSGTSTLVEADVDGDAAADMRIRLGAVVTLAAADFVL